MQKQKKQLNPIFVAKINNQLQSYMLENIAISEHEIKIMNNEQIKVKIKLKSRDIHTYKLKQEKSFKVILKYMYFSSNVDNIRK